MEFKQRNKGIRRRFAIDVGEDSSIRELSETYPYALLFYKCPPIGNVSLQEFEDLAVDRLKLLRIVEKVKLKRVKNTDEYRESLYAEVKKENLMAYFKKTPMDVQSTKLVDYQDRRKDHISHFILRLTYCKTEELRRWFIRQEADLFSVRFFYESRDVIKEWLNYNGFNFEPISEEEKTRLHDSLRFKSNSFLSENTDFYKVPFVDVLELVSKRQVYLEKGFAYIKIKDLSVIISSQFRSQLSQALAFMARALPNVVEDSRVTRFLKSIPLSYLGQDYSSVKGVGDYITRHLLDQLSEKSFPLCMRQLHTALRQIHHLRHQGRLQYLLFLKGIGMSLEEVLQFWREEFTRIVDLDKFERQYAYSVRHSFGKEGKRVNYTPYSCMKIIMSNNPSSGDYHGCPFRHTDQPLLKQRLTAYKVNATEIREIMELVSNGHYQVACSRYFEVTHGSSLKQTISHPNQYFEESYNLARGLKEPTKRTETFVEEKVIQVYESEDDKADGNSATVDVSTDLFTMDDDGMDDIIIAAIE